VPWSLIRENSECYTVRDANGVTVAWLFCRDDSQRYSVGASKLTSEEARPDRQGHQPHSRIHDAAPRGFYPRGGGPRWPADRPYHVALEDTYIRARWDERIRLHFPRFQSNFRVSTGAHFNSILEHPRDYRGKCRARESSGRSIFYHSDSHSDRHQFR
jgi:hypothetical protein